MNCKNISVSRNRPTICHLKVLGSKNELGPRVISSVSSGKNTSLDTSDVRTPICTPLCSIKNSLSRIVVMVLVEGHHKNLIFVTLFQLYP